VCVCVCVTETWVGGGGFSVGGWVVRWVGGWVIVGVGVVETSVSLEACFSKHIYVSL
jgi:hypothetical protein